MLTNKLSNFCCCWYHKGTNFQSNHNNWMIPTRRLIVVADTTKVRIFKQITTGDDPQLYMTCCCWYHKGTNFQANHNLKNQVIIILMLLLIPQRYEFSSKSQLHFRRTNSAICCCWYHKGTNFQANHNSTHLSKQWYWLLLIPQRYEFSSKSQLNMERIQSDHSCCWYHKGTNFQANHNSMTSSTERR